MKIVLYTDDEIINLTPWSSSYSITRSIMSTYETAQIELIIPVELQEEVLPTYGEGAFSLDCWIVIYDNDPEEKERAQFWGPLTNYTHGVEAIESGLILSKHISLNCQSWLYPLEQGQIFLSSNSPNKDHILDINSFWKRFKELGNLPFKNNNIGEVMTRFFVEIAESYRAPLQLDNKRLSNIKIVTNEVDALNYTAERAGTFREIFGLAFHATSTLIQRGNALGLIRDNFQTDTNLIEFFTSLEDLEGEPESDLEARLNARPVLIYRFKPFAFGEEAEKIDGVYIKTPSESALEIPSNLVYSIDYSQSDMDRINAVFITTPLTPSRSIELFGLAGNPHIDNEDIEKAGLRFYSGNWAFFPQGKKSRQETYQKEIQRIIDLSTLVTKDSHHFLNGSIRLKQMLSIKAGVWASINLEYATFYCYVETVTHNTMATDQGLITRLTTVEFTRGFYDT